MSHTVRRKSQCTNTEIIKRAVKAIPGAKIIGEGKHKVYSGTLSGFGIQLPGWKYPVAINLESGEMAFDNYGGSWGDPERLNDFKQRYGVEAGKAVFEQKGMKVAETQLDDGSIECKVTVGGGLDMGGGSGGAKMGGYDVAGPGGS